MRDIEKEEARKRVCVLCNTPYKAERFNETQPFCPSCKTWKLIDEVVKVRAHVYRARRCSLPATLTILEWLRILDHFKWRCAYRGRKYGGHEYHALEHIVSISNGGGTTCLNCVPSCLGCNSAKDNKGAGLYIMRDKIYHVQNELLLLFPEKAYAHHG